MCNDGEETMVDDQQPTNSMTSSNFFHKNKFEALLSEQSYPNGEGDDNDNDDGDDSDNSDVSSDDCSGNKSNDDSNENNGSYKSGGSGHKYTCRTYNCRRQFYQNEHDKEMQKYQYRSKLFCPNCI